MCEIRFIVAFLLLMVIPADCAVCPDASLQKCLDLIPSTTACDVAKSWLHTQNSPVTAKICDQQRQSMEASCKSICPSVSCTACFQKVHKAVAECVDFFTKIQTSTSSCEVLKRNLIQHCTQPKICKACKNSFCQNGGSCHTGPTPHVTSCKCPKGFTGIYCQFSRCDAKHQCKNGGTCVGKNTCSCSRDYTGPQCSRRRLGTAINPAPNAKAILDAGDSGGSGLYWIQPPGEPSPALTYCDMDYQGGGWMLASYGFVHATSTSPLNKAIPNMNNPMGYLWEPEARASSNGLVNLTHGAVMMARAANHMIMAAGGNPSTGGIDSYSYVWSIDLRQNKVYNITFANHNRFNGATGSNGIPQMHLAEFVVQGLKGETGKYVRYALAESLGATWGDAYPTGYGFVNVGVEFGTITQGPFFPSVHSGDGGSNMNYQNKIFQPDVPRGSETYVHKGWYSATATDKIGQTSIWFK